MNSENDEFEQLVADLRLARRRLEPTSRGPVQKRDIPQEIRQRDIKQLIPENTSIWKVMETNGWAGHCTPFRRCSAPANKHGGSERSALLAMLKMLWSQHLYLRGLGQDSCPLRGLFSREELQSDSIKPPACLLETWEGQSAAHTPASSSSAAVQAQRSSAPISERSKKAPPPAAAKAVAKKVASRRRTGRHDASLPSTAAPNGVVSMISGAGAMAQSSGSASASSIHPPAPDADDLPIAQLVAQQGKRLRTSPPRKRPKR